MGKCIKSNHYLLVYSKLVRKLQSRGFDICQDIVRLSRKMGEIINPTVSNDILSYGRCTLFPTERKIAKSHLKLLTIKYY